MNFSRLSDATRTWLNKACFADPTNLTRHVAYRCGTTPWLDRGGQKTWRFDSESAARHPSMLVPAAIELAAGTIAGSDGD